MQCGFETFSEWLLEGRRAFHDLSAGETAAHDLSGECGGGKNPPWISRRKDQAVRLGTEEKASTTRCLTHVTLPVFDSLITIRGNNVIY